MTSAHALSACGGAQNPTGSGGSGATGSGGSGASTSSTGSGASTGSGGSGGAPIPPTPVDCVHKGQGRDIQVGNPMVESGPSIVQVASLSEVDWNNLAPGDTVRVFHRQEPYREKVLLRGQGTEEQPIRLCGVPGPNGELPRVSGDGATTRPDIDFGDLSNGMEDLGVISIWNRDYDIRASHIHIEGLHVSDTLGAPGGANDVLSYTATDGSVRSYRPGAACIRIQEGDHIVIRGNEISGCGNGLFVLARVPESQITRDVLIEANYLHDNGVVGEEGIHTAYVQGIDITVQFNVFGPMRPGGSGNTLKMRVAGDVIRYNVFERGARVLDLVEVEDHAEWVLPWRYEEFKANNPTEIHPGDDERVAAAWAAYQTTYAYGNILYNKGPGAATNLVHYSFDNTQDDRRPGTLYFYHNTIVSLTDASQKTIVRLLDQGPYWGNSGPPLRDNTFDSYPEVVADDNVIFVGPETPGAAPSYFEFTRYRADKLTLGKNWIMTGWDAAIPGYNQMFPGFGNAVTDDAQYVYAGGNDTHHVTGVENLVTGAGAPVDLTTFKPLSGGPLQGAAAPLPVGVGAGLVPLYEIDPPTKKTLDRPSFNTLGARE